MVLDLPHETENKRYAETHKAELAAEHTKENCLKRLKYGREILEKGLGFAVKGFRAPAAQSSDGMFAALHEGVDLVKPNIEELENAMESIKRKVIGEIDKTAECQISKYKSLI
jgi:predicted deacetylase